MNLEYNKAIAIGKQFVANLGLMVRWEGRGLFCFVDASGEITTLPRHINSGFVSEMHFAASEEGEVFYRIGRNAADFAWAWAALPINLLNVRPNDSSVPAPYHVLPSR